ncbi:MAG: glycosyltransferase family 2 protein [Candidatus Omnitrophica bacterium]|jgi:glycosyltransferase involved in cell wall biosynthesis|nr:glycosyltransferase family 2 protein [Candidatus Omnitrophota bacterium]
MKENSLSVVLPIYNEAAGIERLIRDMLPFLGGLTDDLEVLAINDGSTDKSAEIISGLAEKEPRIKIINNSRNNGYGWALRRGIRTATKKWLLIFDSDGQFDIGDLKGMWDKRYDRDFLLGWRRRRNDNGYRRLLGAAGNRLANLFLRSIFIKDINCGFKLFKTGLLKNLPLLSSGGVINFEILYRLKNSGYSFIQLPVTHYPRSSGRATGGNLATVIKILAEANRIIFKYAPV